MLRANPKALATFEKFSPSHKREYVTHQSRNSHWGAGSIRFTATFSKSPERPPTVEPLVGRQIDCATPFVEARAGEQLRPEAEGIRVGIASGGNA
jgi:hypothetical protein